MVTSDIITTTALVLLWVMLASVLMRRFDDLERRFIWLSLLAHLFAAIGNVVVTTYYYGGGDMTSYFATATFIAERLRSDFLGLAPTLVNVILQREVALPFPGMMVGSNTGSIQALSGFLAFLLQDSLYGICVLIAAASFFAKIAVYRVFKRELHDQPQRNLLACCLLLPSTVFWSAGLLKEPIAMIGLTGLICGGHRIVADRRFVSGALLLIVGAALAGLFKGYVLLVFGMASGAWFLGRSVQRHFGTAFGARYVFMALAIAVATFLLAGSALPQFAPDVLEAEAESAQQIGGRITGGSNYDLGSGGSLGSRLPLALASVFFRPLLIEVSNPLMAISAVEMTWLSVLFLMAAFRRSPIATFRIILGSPGLMFCLGFVLTMSVGVGLTTSNLGTLSRYRMPLMTFYALLLVSISRRSLAERARQTAAWPAGQQPVLTSQP